MDGNGNQSLCAFGPAHQQFTIERKNISIETVQVSFFIQKWTLIETGHEDEAGDDKHAMDRK